MTRIVLSILVLLSLAACETVEGAGQDVKHAGTAISQTANQTQAGM